MKPTLTDHVIELKEALDEFIWRLVYWSQERAQRGAFWLIDKIWRATRRGD